VVDINVVNMMPLSMCVIMSITMSISISINQIGVLVAVLLLNIDLKLLSMNSILIYNINIIN